MKKQQSPKQQPKISTNSRASAQALTDEQLKEVVGGVNPQPLPPGLEHPPQPCFPPDPWIL